MRSHHIAEFRFYAELNDFLPSEHKQQSIRYRFSGHPGIKDPIEACGIPHPEVALIIVNGQSVGFDYQLQANDHVSVYPIFRRLDISDSVQLRAPLPSDLRFILDVNLGKLARLMRLLGFDSLYRNNYQDSMIVQIAANEQRIVLTRDRRLLHAKKIQHGYWVRAVKAKNQLDEVVHHFDLGKSIHAFARCLVCNGMLAPVDKAEILDQLEPKTKRYYETFRRCVGCQQIYWEGSHLENMRRRLATLLASSAAIRV